jgi:cysteine desulfurase
VIVLDLAGIAVSSGSACSSGKVRRSHVLDAMDPGSADAETAIRVSLGWESIDEDVDRLVDAWCDLYNRALADTERSV